MLRLFRSVSATDQRRKNVVFINRNFPESVWRNLISGKRYTFQNGAKQINLFRVLYNDVTRRGSFVNRLAEFPMHFIMFVLLSLLSASSIFSQF